MEFVAPLARIDPIYKEEEEAFKVNDVQRITIVKSWKLKVLTYFKFVLIEKDDLCHPSTVAYFSGGGILDIVACGSVKQIFVSKQLWKLHEVAKFKSLPSPFLPLGPHLKGIVKHVM